MSKNKTSFSTVSFFKAALPSYFFPFMCSGLSGYFLDKPDLMNASYTTIAIPSLLATVFSFAILAYFQKRGILLIHKFKMTLLLSSVLTILAFLVIYTFQLERETGDIITSTVLGTAILTLTKPIKNKQE